MKNDQMPPGRRTLLGWAAVLGVATTARFLTADTAESPKRAAPEPGARPAGRSGAAAESGAGSAAGPQAGRAPKAPGRASYRLQPMAGYAPQRGAPARPQVRKAPILRIPGLVRSMVLSFDDGPDPRYTRDILRTLRSHDARAMFFVCGEMAAAHPDLLREMADDGHVIGNHTWSHPLLPRLSRAGIRRQMERTCEVVDAVVGTPPVWFRAPYGAWNRAAFEVGADLGMEPLAWTVDTLDWRTPGTRFIVRRVLRGAGPGVVVLSHDAGGDRSQSVRALRRYLPALLDEGYRFTVPSRYRV
ncbi:polysaccharide deacetylase family protein [Streptomyces sp. p1417]|uniref:Polysaccharide deacetylase family protein n=1 Tax=Streptomyces typhae TaxID=2681492 RepID=A0A6L6WX07_9ACTN|nr:polysaccharide deacetylase family protein [Streptomyces typhae]MVO85031.1 polysaccharide deacetylase family protein [Streptomyces typhae]